MTNNKETKLCPLTEHIYCRKEDCAWYISNKFIHECAIKTIALKSDL